MKRDDFYELVSPSQLLEQIRGHGTPSYLYFRDIIVRRIEELRACLGDRFALSFSCKANPNPEILSLFREHGLGADVSSGGELEVTLRAGFSPSRIQLSGPGKSTAELKLAVDSEIDSINVESEQELYQVIEIAQAAKKRPRIGFRVNPLLPEAQAGIRMTGQTAFGIPEEDLEEILQLALEHDHVLDFQGIHAHVGSQVLEARSVVATMRHLLELGLRLRRNLGVPIQMLNFGGGFGINYFPKQSPLDLGLLQSEVTALMSEERYQDLIAEARLMVEPGRFLVGESGVYAVGVRYRKQSRGREFAIVDGGLHQCYVLAGGMGQLLRRNFEMDVLATEARGECAPYSLDVCGCLCTPQDTLARNFPASKPLRTGDYVVFFNCGAYGRTASPGDFISHPPVREVLV